MAAFDELRDGRRLGQAALLAAAGWLPVVAALAALRPETAKVVALTGVAAGGALGLLWWTLTGLFGATAVECGCSWTGLVLWQAGVAALGVGTALPALARLAGLGAFMLAVGAFLALDHFGSALVRTGIWRTRAFWRVAPFVLVAAIQLPLGALLVALSYRPDAFPEVRDLGLGLIGAGFVVPALIVSLGVARRGGKGARG